jgi:spermidine synthase
MAFLLYHVIAFFSGASVLMIEVLGSRIIAPYLGTAFFVWVNVIGVILAALSAGYWLGGRAADKHKWLLPHIFLAGAFACAAIILERPLLPSFGAAGPRLGSFFASLLLFAPPSLILGMVSPYLVKLSVKDMETLGRSAGAIYASSTLGSIAGTFITGFWLVPSFTVTQLLWGVAGLLVLLALVAVKTGAHAFNWKSVLMPALTIVASAATATALTFGGDLHKKTNRIVFERNSRYYNIRIHEEPAKNGDIRRTMLLDGSTQSARYLRSTESPYAYIDLSEKMIAPLMPESKAVLALGGGGYSVPAFIKKNYPAADVTVVEIDPEVTDAAMRFFLDGDDMGIKTINEDARIFLNRNASASVNAAAGKKYDIIYTDAYSGAFSIPQNLATKEAFLAMKNSLAPGGAAIFNIASAAEGKYSALFRALWKTINTAFPETFAFLVHPESPASPQNIIVVASAQKGLLNGRLAGFMASRYENSPITSDVPLLTDDFAPTENLSAELVSVIYPNIRHYQE